MRGELVLHTILIPAALSLPLLRGSTAGRAPTTFQNDWFCTRISNFFQSPIFSIASTAPPSVCISDLIGALGVSQHRTVDCVTLN